MSIFNWIFYAANYASPGLITGIQGQPLNEHKYTSKIRINFIQY